jgi:hypothetical protein
MILSERVRRIAVTVAFAAVAAISHHVVASAQEISESHLKAARAAVDAINVTDEYDVILPAAARALKTQLIEKNPDLQELIIKTVDDQTMKLASRRGDLEREAALAYARSFNEDQLNQIAAFYQSEAGLKLLSNGPIVTRELIKAAQIWQNGSARDLAQTVGAEIAQKAAKAVPPAQDGAAPVLPVTEGGAAPGTQAPAAEGSPN